MLEIIESDRTTFFDCDDTLIMWKTLDMNLPIVSIGGRDFQVHTKHVQKIKDYHLMGFKVFVWSTSGYEWAKTVVEALNLEEYVDFVMCKPHRIFDDCIEIKDTLKHGYIKL